MHDIIFHEEFDGMIIERVVRDYEFTMPTKHLHNEYELYYLLDGERYYFIEKQTFYVKKGSLVLVNKGLIHKTSMAKDSYHDRILISLQEEKMNNFFLMTGYGSLGDFFEKYTGVIDLTPQEQGQVEALIFGISKEIHEKKEGFEWMAYMKLMELFLFIIRNHQNHLLVNRIANLNIKHIKVQKIADYIVKNYRDVESLEQLSKQFFVSKYYLSRIFRDITGFTVTEYINIQRVKKAKELLLESEYNITEISEQLGYESITYFEKVFKRYTEFTPLKYRKFVTQNLDKLV